MATHHDKLSLWMAILVNVSIMFGAGFFLNTVVLAQRAGSLCFVGYLVIAVLMIPLITSIGKLLAQYPTGGFYTYSAQSLSPLMGFISCWSYFIGKLGSAVVIIDLFARLIKSIIPSLSTVPSTAISTAIIGLFVVCNMFNLRTNMSIIYTFIVLKLIPVGATVISSLWLFHHWSLPAETFYWENIPASIPLVLFALVGFESACSISRSIQDAQKNGPKAVFASFAIVVCLTTMYQLMFFLPLNTTLMAQQNYLGAFPALLSLVFPNNPTAAYVVTKALHMCIAAAALGGSYGIIFSNHWNLYTLAENNHVFFSRFLTRMNRHGVPFLCVLIEATICLAYILCAGNNQLFLQQVNVLGCSIAYVMSVIGLFALQNRSNASNKEKAVTALALGSCFIFIGTCIKNLLTDGPAGLFVYSALIVLGIGMYFASAKSQKGGTMIIYLFALTLFLCRTEAACCAAEAEEPEPLTRSQILKEYLPNSLAKLVVEYNGGWQRGSREYGQFDTLTDTAVYSVAKKARNLITQRVDYPGRIESVAIPKMPYNDDSMFAGMQFSKNNILLTRVR